MSDVISLTALEAAERVRARELAPEELFDAYRARAAADELNAFTWVAEAAPCRAPSAYALDLSRAITSTPGCSRSHARE